MKISHVPNQMSISKQETGITNMTTIMKKDLINLRTVNLQQCLIKNIHLNVSLESWGWIK